MTKEFMSDELFSQLLESANQAVAISKGKMEPSRKFDYPIQQDSEMDNLKAELALYKKYFGKAAKEIPAFSKYA